MGLIQKLIKKFRYLERVNFDDFDLNLNKNRKIITSYLKIIYKDMERIEKYPLIQKLIPDVMENREKNYKNLKFYLQSEGVNDCYAKNEYPEYYEYECERFALGYSELIYFAQCYALYYLYASNSREELAKTKVASRLVCIYDTMRFAFLQYMLMGRGEYAEWKDLLKCEGESKIHDFAQNIFDNSCLIAKLLKAVQDENSTDVFEVYNDLSSNMVVECLNPFEI